MRFLLLSLAARRGSGESLLQSEGHEGGTCGDRDVLAPFEQVRDRRSHDGCSGLETPERLSAARIERKQVALAVSGENQTASRRKEPAGRRRDKLELPLRD